MNQNMNEILARELATKINKLVNIPLIREEDEQVFFELIVLILLDVILNGLDVNSNN
ncbi:MAG: hypothetical protein PHU99_06575 [Candidatus Cloacimonetes bacterium]|nr:hypothetical protein [Candidatus Cloacimonadota bacterium]MDD2544153.1 hypothetical protein [Candidatus Cloacimonadota bacterium]MDD2684508.1 hypothetical protein [Candidatus Cloacimonadota bacterium]MDD3097365.1 hypothetical protein [Candidatus Cloacimonadota bacterium]MDD4035052.1 hypothetical protein [Candidatus Cloacimonadota bacterium]